MISNTWNWVLEWTKGVKCRERGDEEYEAPIWNSLTVQKIHDTHSIIILLYNYYGTTARTLPYSHTSYLVFPPTKVLMCRSTGMSFGGTMGTRTQPDRFWALGWTTWLSPSNIPSAKMSTARIMVSGEDKVMIQKLLSVYSAVAVTA